MENIDTPQSAHKNPQLQTLNNEIARPESNSPSKSKNLILTTLLVVFIVIIGVIGVFFRFYNQQSEKQLASQIKTSPTSTIDPTVNWKTYTNTTWNYEFKYPSTWTLKEFSSAIDVIGGPSNIELLNVPVFTRNPSLTFEQDSEKAAENFGTECDENPNPTNCPTPKKIESKSNNNLSQYYYIITARNQRVVTIQIPSVLSKDSGYFIEISYNNTDPTSIQLFDTIISTFKFINENSVDTSTWKTYTNSALNYSIKYPSDFQIDTLDVSDIEITRKGVPNGGQGGKVPYGSMDIAYRGNQGLQKGIDLSGFPSKTIAINGFGAVQFLHDPSTPYLADYFIENANHTTTVRASINTSGDKGYEKSTFDTFMQILSTFKFIDQNQSTAWKTFHSNDLKAFSTSDWESFPITTTEANYSFNYPPNWISNYTTFSDQNGNKIAELSPGMVILQKGQKCFDSTSINSTTIVSQNYVTIGNFNAIRRVEKITTEEGTIWYPNIYCFSEEGNAFVMTFYDTNLQQNQHALYEQVLSTFKFTQ